jgi:Spy/CpxP family protein refolding chaperone
MKMNKVVAIVAIAVVACAAFAQGGGQGRRGGGQRGGGNMYSPMNLVNVPEVQAEINLTEDQKTKITELRTSLRTKMQEARTNAGTDRTAQAEAAQKVNADAAKSLNEILNADQAKRVRELQIQWSGVNIVLTDKEVQAALNVTDDQKTKFKDLQDRQRTANQELQQKVQNQEVDATQARETRTKNAKILEEEIGKILTDDQKTKLTAMGGKALPKPAMQTGRRGGGGGF